MAMLKELAASEKEKDRQIKELRGTADELDTLRDTLQEELDGLEKAVQQGQRDRERLEDGLGQATARIEALQKALALAQQDLTQAQRQVRSSLLFHPSITNDSKFFFARMSSHSFPKLYSLTFLSYPSNFIFTFNDKMTH